MTHSFDVDIAKQYDVYVAILLDKIFSWYEHNRLNEKYLIEGVCWAVNGDQAFLRQFPYMTEHQIKRSLETMIEDGLIVNRKSERDGKMWYTVTVKGQNLILHQSGDEHEANVITACNPFADSTERPIAETIEAYASRSLAKMSAGNIDDFRKYKQDLSDELIRFAIDEACANGVATFAYAKAIMDSLIAKKIETLEQAKAESERRKSWRKKGEKQNETQYDNPLLRARIVY